MKENEHIRINIPYVDMTEDHKTVVDMLISTSITTLISKSYVNELETLVIIPDIKVRTC